MAEFRLPPNSRIDKAAGKSYSAPAGAKNTRRFRIYRFDPSAGARPRIDSYQLDMANCAPMVLDALLKIKNEIDPTLSLRRSCREGICGSCAMNINGLNTLACTKACSELGGGDISIYPLPHLPVLKDLVTDLSNFYAQYAAVKPWLQTSTPTPPDRERLQSKQEQQRIDLERSLEYPENSAGRRMQTEFIAVPQGWNAGQVIDYMRDTPDLPPRFYEIYAVDHAQHMQGQRA